MSTDRQPARPARLARPRCAARRAARRARRRLESRARRDQRAQRQEGLPAGAAVRRHHGLSEGLSRAHLQHRAARRACPRSCASASRRTHQALVQELRGKPAQWQARRRASYDPVLRRRAARCSRTSQQGADVDLFAFPSPLWHELDGGRYIGTGCLVVTRDFDTDWVNVGTYRVHDPRPQPRRRSTWCPASTARIQYDKHMKAGKPLPGVHRRRRRSARLPRSPASRCRSACASTTTSARSSASRSRWCKASSPDCRFPAASEIVLEGSAQPNDERIEGPFGEFHGYYPGKAAHRAGGDDRAHLLPQQSDHRRQPAGQAAERLLLFEGGDALGAAVRRAGRGRRAGREGGLGARDRRRAHVQRRLDQAALSPATRARPGTSSTSAASAPTCRATRWWSTTTSIRRTCRK